MSLPNLNAPLSSHAALSAGRRAANVLLDNLMFLAFEPAQEGRIVLDPQEKWTEFAKWLCFSHACNQSWEQTESAICNVRELLAPSHLCDIAGFCEPSHAEALLSLSNRLSLMPKLDFPDIGKGIEIAVAVLEDSGADCERNVDEAIDVMFIAGIPDDGLDEYLQIQVNSLRTEPVPGESPDETCNRWRRARNRLRGTSELQELVDSVDWIRMRRIMTPRYSFDANQIGAKLDIEFRQAAAAVATDRRQPGSGDGGDLVVPQFTTKEATWEAGANQPVAATGSDARKPDGFDDLGRFWYDGKEVRFGRAARRRHLVSALWDNEGRQPKAPQEIEKVICTVWGINHQTSDAAFRQLCSDTNKSVFEVLALPLRICNEIGFVRLQIDSE